jgi:hypothetical protein
MSRQKEKRVNKILIGKGSRQIHLLARYGNRHGLIAGATGTGKTVSLLLLAEGFSRLGVPVFMADVKGDVAGLAMAGRTGDKIKQRVKQIGISDYTNEANPVVFWDIYGKLGHPVRATVSEMGPGLLANILGLNQIQTGVMEILFTIADQQGLLLLDLDDLRAMLKFISDNRKEISAQYGLVSSSSVAAIQRALLSLERQGGKNFFGEPALELRDLMRTDLSGRGVINILAADRLILNPKLYSSFLLWLLSELFENLPETGDPEKPVLVFFFDEAHLLFDNAPPALFKRVEQVVRLIRSKGVGIYFCSQYPDDLPGEILGQLGNRIQHALRAYTPRDQKAVKTAAQTFVPNPLIDVAQTISSLAVGQALVSTLQEKAIPMPVEKTLICPPRCRLGTLTLEERQMVRARSPLGTRYDKPVNRQSAHEILAQRALETQADTLGQNQGPNHGQEKDSGKINEFLWGTKKRQGMVETLAKQTARTVGSQIGRRIVRGLLGGILGGIKGR